ncbi:MAG: hypothetical protein PHD54_16065 [Desulfuromonadaceae bacterium]|nr:hypothetical protein [Desulfuromonadaceae bacterium]
MRVLAKNTIGLVTGLAIVFIIGLMCISCGEDSESVPKESQPAKVPYNDMVVNFIKNDSTYKFDGVDGSVNFPKTESSASRDTPSSEIRDWEFTATYQTLHPGHGNRTGQVLIELITTHTAVIKIENGQITSAVCDGVWDMLAGKSVTYPPKTDPGKCYC